jgi:type IV pilus assembly protein PilY1
VARVKGHPNPVVVFGGGYDASAEDGTAGTTMGHAVYVLDALDGSVVKVFQALSSGGAGATINRSVAADVSLVDTDYDGKVDRAYAVDLGGQVYRIDFEGTTTYNPPSSWTIFKLADLSAGTTSRRKFFYGPDVVHMKTMTALMFGSGDREKPLQADTQDHFFQIFDRNAVKGAPASVTPIVFGSLSAAAQVSSIAGDGCYMALAQGEKVVNAATSIAGYSYFGTNRPASSSPSGQSCTAALGVAKSYAMPLFCVASSGTILAGGGLPPSPVAGIVTVTDKNGKEVQVPFVIGAPNPKKSGIEGIRVNPTIKVPRKRRYWYSEGAR